MSAAEGRGRPKISAPRANFTDADPGRGRAGDRAQDVLSAAGVCTEPDPHWVGLIP